MGEVVKMEDWRKRKGGVKPSVRNKPFVYNRAKVDVADVDKPAIIEYIGVLLAEAVTIEQSVRHLRSVSEREQAVIKAFDLVMEAHKYAEAHGFKVERVSNEQGTTNTFNIIG